MGHLRPNGNVCGYIEEDRRLNEQLIYGISDEEMMIEIIRKLTATKDTNLVTTM